MVRLPWFSEPWGPVSSTAADVGRESVGGGSLGASLYEYKDSD
jgi:hypothetical protein